MASYLEIKQVLKEILSLDTDVDETSDIVVPLGLYSSQESAITLSNSDLKSAFDSMKNFDRDNLELSSQNYREVALQFLGPPSRNFLTLEPMVDSSNGLTYSIGPASSEYCLFLLDVIAERFKVEGRRSIGDLRGRIRIHLRHRIKKELDNGNPMELLSDFLRATTVKISSTKTISIRKLRDFASSFEFHVIYKSSIAISEYTDLQEMYSLGNSVFRYSREEISSPPLRIYNREVLDYYTMAMETRDPFTMYISFYHVVEHYFDAVFRKKLTENIREKITHPDFSYKSEEKLYDLAKYIKKHMNSDDDSGKGNEFESLKYVLMEYVPIEDLKNQINSINPNAMAYYQNTLVPFTSSTKTKIAWADSQGAYTNIATRIYETRNSLVHSKSGQVANQYRPYKNNGDLTLEIALIKAVAELVIINSSEIM